MTNKIQLGDLATLEIKEDGLDIKTSKSTLVNIGRLIGANGEWDLKNGVLIFENGNISEIKNIEDDK